MAVQAIGLNVYEIDGVPVVPGSVTVFGAGSTEVFPYLAGRDSRLYSILKPVDNHAYGVIETPAIVKGLMNA